MVTVHVTCDDDVVEHRHREDAGGAHDHFRRRDVLPARGRGTAYAKFPHSRDYAEQRIMRHALGVSRHGSKAPLGLGDAVDAGRRVGDVEAVGIDREATAEST
jgi:hypothetical protein